MNIVQIEDFFHPDAGYQVNILSKYLSRAGHRVYIFTSEMEKVPENLTVFFNKNDIEKRDRLYETTYNVKIERFPLIGYFSNRYIFAKDIFKRIKEMRPDILFVHGNDSYAGVRILSQPRVWRVPVISDSHMLRMATVNRYSNVFRCFYRKFVTPQIIKNNITVIRTQDDEYVNECLGVPMNQCPYIPLGSDVLLFHKDDIKRHSFRKKYNISDNAFVVVYAGKLDSAKGGDLLATAILKKIDIRDVVFLIVGNSQGEYGEELEKQFTYSENRVLRFPTQRYSDLAVFYQASDLAVFPRQCSLSFYDVQACGLPVVSEKNSINSKRNSNGNGICFEPGNAQSLREAMLSLMRITDKEYLTLRENSITYIKKWFSYENTAKAYMIEMEKTINNYGMRN